VAFYVELSRLCVLGNFEEHYRLKGFLGKGHFSVVYEGENMWTRKVVAMKCYNKVLMMEKPGGNRVGLFEVLSW
jgi:serine/threonine protein kinase